MKSVIVFALVAIVFLHFKTTSSKIIIPREFEDSENAEDHIDHVKYILTRNSDPNKRTASSVSANSADQCEAPDNANIKTVVTNKIVPVNWVNRPLCSLVRVPVKIETRKHSNPFPSYVRLSRCMGSSQWLPTLQHCTVKRKELITVMYMDAFANYQEFGAKMYNHTECEEECIVKHHHCNPVTEKYQDCQCKCIINDSYCDSSYQTFDKYLCGCRCNTVRQCSMYREWNPTTCKCQCAKSIRDMCEKVNFVIDESTCSCVLPPPPQPTTTAPP
ncbi:balbiani ring protein 3-like, partial [Actinia tenebrosa]|uniref:Balbiani ring protein 3-like n=1 Tax=Actinia tenebrosa TaxID=6105 RepID=A0A6P8I7A4_ACTTE